MNSGDGDYLPSSEVSSIFLLLRATTNNPIAQEFNLASFSQLQLNQVRVFA